VKGIASLLIGPLVLAAYGFTNANIRNFGLDVSRWESAYLQYDGLKDGLVWGYLFVIPLVGYLLWRGRKPAAETLKDIFE
jgi:hypothetical protein